MSNLVKKWKTCPKFKTNILYGSVSFLIGCVSFWNIIGQKTVAQINDEFKIFTPQNLRRAAWTLNGIFKGAALALWIKALKDYMECR